MKLIFVRIISVICIIAMLFAMGIAAIPANAEGIKNLSGVWYDLDVADDGFAAGLLYVRVDGWFDFDAYPADVVAFWADANGKLAGYDSIARFSLTAISTIYRFPELQIIPEGADRIRVYLAPKGTNNFLSIYKEALLPENAAFKTKTSPNNVFAVVSDTHVINDDNNANTRKFKNMLKDIVTNVDGVESLVINGDMINSSNKSNATSATATAEYAKLQSVKTQVCPDMPIYMAIGNHDLWPVGFNAGVTLQEMTQLFCQNVTLPDGSHPNSLFYDFWIDDNHFVFIGDSGREGNYLWLDENALTWVDTTIASGYREGKNTFIFMHQPMPNTVAGTITDFGQTNGHIDNAYDLYKILKKYPDAVMFSSHSHYGLDSVGNAYGTDPNYPNVFGTSSVARPYDLRKGVEMADSSEGYIVEVYDDYIMLRGRDFEKGLWKPSSQYVVSLVEDGNINNIQNNNNNQNNNQTNSDNQNTDTENSGNNSCCDCCPANKQNVAADDKSESSKKADVSKNSDSGQTSGGCGSVVGISTIALVTFIAGTCAIKKKKEE